MSRFTPTTRDWAEITLSKPAPKRDPAAGGARVMSLGSASATAGSSRTTADAKFVTRQGPHQSAGGRTINQQRAAPVNHKKIAEDTENYRNEKVSHNFSLTLMRARQQKGLSQKDLALQCAEREQVIKEYENGKAQPNNTVIAKMERALGIHLRGKDAGKEIVKPAAKKAAAKPGGKKSK